MDGWSSLDHSRPDQGAGAALAAARSKSPGAPRIASDVAETADVAGFSSAKAAPAVWEKAPPFWGQRLGDVDNIFGYGLS